jgi:GNAT superfamily N-acetyltransferase
MPWIFTEDAGEFAAVAGEFLSSRPAENTIELVVTDMVRRRGADAFGGGAPLFGWWRPAAGPERPAPGAKRPAAGSVECTFVHTPPYPGLLVSGAPERSIGPLAQDLAALGRPLPGINGDDDAALAFSADWQGLTGAGADIRMRSRLYRLGELLPPAPAPPGAARVAVTADLDLLEPWLDAFSREGAAERPVPGAAADRISFGGLTLWEDDGLPVAVAGQTRRVSGVVRIGPVYTPPEHRRRGYGGAVTAAVTRAALDSGARAVVLFTDLANPTSNSVYQRLGYQPVHDRVIIDFTP